MTTFRVTFLVDAPQNVRAMDLCGAIHGSLEHVWGYKRVHDMVIEVIDPDQSLKEFRREEARR